MARHHPAQVPAGGIDEDVDPAHGLLRRLHHAHDGIRLQDVGTVEIELRIPVPRRCLQALVGGGASADGKDVTAVLQQADRHLAPQALGAANHQRLPPPDVKQILRTILSHTLFPLRPGQISRYRTDASCPQMTFSGPGWGMWALIFSALS